jgi:hypothetical protein
MRRLRARAQGVEREMVERGVAAVRRRVEDERAKMRAETARLLVRAKDAETLAEHERRRAKEAEERERRTAGEVLGLRARLANAAVLGYLAPTTEGKGREDAIRGK